MRSCKWNELERTAFEYLLTNNLLAKVFILKYPVRIKAHHLCFFNKVHFILSRFDVCNNSFAQLMAFEISATLDRLC